MIHPRLVAIVVAIVIAVVVVVVCGRRSAFRRR
jgi:hypothetical protein